MISTEVGHSSGSGISDFTVTVKLYHSSLVWSKLHCILLLLRWIELCSYKTFDSFCHRFKRHSGIIPIDLIGNCTHLWWGETWSRASSYVYHASFISPCEIKNVLSKVNTRVTKSGVEFSNGVILISVLSGRCLRDFAEINPL